MNGANKWIKISAIGLVAAALAAAICKSGLANVRKKKGNAAGAR